MTRRPDKVVRLFQSETAEILDAPEPAGVRATIVCSGGARRRPRRPCGDNPARPRHREHRGRNRHHNADRSAAIARSCADQDDQRARRRSGQGRRRACDARSDLRVRRCRCAAASGRESRRADRARRGRAGRTAVYRRHKRPVPGPRATARYRRPCLRSANRSTTSRCAPTIRRSRNTRRRLPS